GQMPGEALLVFDGDKKLLRERHPKWKFVEQLGEWRVVPGTPDFIGVIAEIERRCARAGAVDLRRVLRGRGTWRQHDGSLIVHLGDQVWTRAGRRALGRHGEYVYAGETPLLATPVVGRGMPPGQTSLAGLQRWRWQWPALSPRLLNGWLTAALVNGALAVR